MFDKAPLIHQFQKRVLSREIVFSPILLSGAGGARGVWFSVSGSGEVRRGDVRETEKPKVSGWSLKRRVRIVDLPVPEGPDITIGRRVWDAGLLEGGIEGGLGV